MIKDVHFVEIMEVDDSIGVLVVLLLFAFGAKQFVARVTPGMQADH